jgi:hypothetical protein
MWHSQTHIARIWTAEAVYFASLGGKLGFPAPPSDWLGMGFTPSQQPHTQTNNPKGKFKNPTQFLHPLKRVVSSR